MNPDALPDEPSELEPIDFQPDPEEPPDASDLDFTDMPCTDAGSGDGDESQWEAFIPDEDEWDPEPNPGDFWIENSGACQSPYFLV
jgi:hypothetical protein